MTLQAGTPLAPLTEPQIAGLRADLSVLSAEEIAALYLPILSSTEFGRSILAGASATAVRALLSAITQTDGDARYLLQSATTAYGRSLANTADAAAAITLLGAVTQAAGDTRYGVPSTLGKAVSAAATIAEHVAAITTAVPRTITAATTLGPTDVNALHDFTRADAAAITVPSNATLGAVPGQSVICFRVTSTGRPTFTGDGATVTGTVPASGSIITLLCGVAANTWAIA